MKMDIAWMVWEVLFLRRNVWKHCVRNLNVPIKHISSKNTVQKSSQVSLDSDLEKESSSFQIDPSTESPYDDVFMDSTTTSGKRGVEEVSNSQESEDRVLKLQAQEVCNTPLYSLTQPSLDTETHQSMIRTVHNQLLAQDPKFNSENQDDLQSIHEDSNIDTQDL